MSKRLAESKQYQHDGERWAFVFTLHPKRAGQCRVRHCKRPARVRVRADRHMRVENYPVCITCTSRLYRANNPAREAYRQICDRALRRNQIFAITFEQFCAIPRFAEYLARRGRAIDELHLDRVKVHLGYVPGNLQVLTTAENLKKQREVDHPF